jgi:hypothetical protein
VAGMAPLLLCRRSRFIPLDRLLLLAVGFSTDEQHSAAARPAPALLSWGRWRNGVYCASQLALQGILHVHMVLT